MKYSCTIKIDKPDFAKVEISDVEYKEALVKLLAKQGVKAKTKDMQILYYVESEQEEFEKEAIIETKGQEEHSVCYFPRTETWVLKD